MLTYTEFKQLNEKLTPSQFRPYMKMWTDELRKKYDSWFGDKVYRLYFSLDGSQYINSDNSLEQQTSTILSKYGFKIENFDALLCTKDGKNIQKINKVLNSLKDKDNSITDDLLKQLANHKEKVVDKRITKGDNTLLVISRHPYDIAGMSTDRDWASCMNLVNDSGVDQTEYIEQDIKHGTLIAYLIDKEDININKPIGRTLIKPFINNRDENDILLYPETKWYGKENSKANQIIIKWLEEKQGKKIGLYKLNCDLYQDGKTIITNINNNMSIDQLCYIYNIENYTINKDGTINVNGDVDFYENTFKKFPLKFNKVSGDFNCSACPNLETLEGSPKKLAGSFNCSFCSKLKSLEGAPKQVSENFDCTECIKLETLEGAPIKVEGNFDCSECPNLKSLGGTLLEVGGEFNCADCSKLESLIGSPKKVGGTFYCSNNKNLVTLKGAPKEVGGTFSCLYCPNLETLDGSPKEVGEDFDCRKCPKLKSLNGIGKVGGTILTDIKNI